MASNETLNIFSDKDIARIEQILKNEKELERSVRTLLNIVESKKDLINKAVTSPTNKANKEAQNLAKTFDNLRRALTRMNRDLKEGVNISRSFANLSDRFSKVFAGVDQLNVSGGILGRVRQVLGGGVSASMSASKLGNVSTALSSTVSGVISFGKAMMDGVKAVDKFVNRLSVMANAMREFSDYVSVSQSLGQRLEVAQADRAAIVKQSQILGVPFNTLSRGTLAARRAGYSGDIGELSKFLAVAARQNAGDSEMFIKTIVAIMSSFSLTQDAFQDIAEKILTTANSTVLTVEDIATAFNYVISMAREAGVASEDLLALIGSLAQGGIRPSSIGTGLRQVFTKMSIEGHPFRTAVYESLAKEGLEPTSRNLVKSMVANLGILATDEMHELFRQTALPVTVGLKNMRSELETLTMQLDLSSGTMEKLTTILESAPVTNLDNVVNSWKQLKDSANELISNIFETLLNLAKSTFSWLQRGVDKMNQNALDIKIAKKNYKEGTLTGDAKTFVDTAFGTSSDLGLLVEGDKATITHKPTGFTTSVNVDDLAKIIATGGADKVLLELLTSLRNYSFGGTVSQSLIDRAGTDLFKKAAEHLDFRKMLAPGYIDQLDRFMMLQVAANRMMPFNYNFSQAPIGPQTNWSLATSKSLSLNKVLPLSPDLADAGLVESILRTVGSPKADVVTPTEQPEDKKLLTIKRRIEIALDNFFKDTAENRVESFESAMSTIIHTAGQEKYNFEEKDISTAVKALTDQAMPFVRANDPAFLEAFAGFADSANLFEQEIYKLMREQIWDTIAKDIKNVRDTDAFEKIVRQIKLVGDVDDERNANMVLAQLMDYALRHLSSISRRVTNEQRAKVESSEAWKWLSTYQSDAANPLANFEKWQASVPEGSSKSIEEFNRLTELFSNQVKAITQNADIVNAARNVIESGEAEDNLNGLTNKFLMYVNMLAKLDEAVAGDESGDFIQAARDMFKRPTPGTTKLQPYSKFGKYLSPYKLGTPDVTRPGKYEAKPVPKWMSSVFMPKGESAKDMNDINLAASDLEELITAYSNAVMGVINPTFDIIQNGYQAELQMIQRIYDARMKYYDDQVDKISELTRFGLMSEIELDRNRAQIDAQRRAEEESYQREQAAIRRKMAIAEKVQATAQTIQAGAVAAVAAFKSGDPVTAAILAGLAGGATIASLAAIASSPIPEYATGVLSHSGGRFVIGERNQPEFMLAPGDAGVASGRAIGSAPAGTQVVPTEGTSFLGDISSIARDVKTIANRRSSNYYGCN